MSTNKYVQLHPTTVSNGASVLDETVNVYPYIGPDSFKGFDPSLASPGSFKPQEMLQAGVNIKKIKFSPSAAASLLGSGDLVINLLDLLYPVNTIYISYTHSDTCPIQSTLGGVWERIEGRFLIGTGTNSTSGTSYGIGTTGGYEDAVLIKHTHTATVGDNQHSHGITFSVPSVELSAKKHVYPANDNNGFYGVTQTTTTTKEVSTDLGTHGHTVTIAESDGVASGNGRNMPPYRVVDRWRRVS